MFYYIQIAVLIGPIILMSLAKLARAFQRQARRIGEQLECDRKIKRLTELSGALPNDPASLSEFQTLYNGIAGCKQDLANHKSKESLKDIEVVRTRLRDQGQKYIVCKNRNCSEPAIKVPDKGAVDLSAVKDGTLHKSLHDCRIECDEEWYTCDTSTYKCGGVRYIDVPANERTDATKWHKSEATCNAQCVESEAWICVDGTTCEKMKPSDSRARGKTAYGSEADCKTYCKVYQASGGGSGAQASSGDSGSSNGSEGGGATAPNLSVAGNDANTGSGASSDDDKPSSSSNIGLIVGIALVVVFLFVGVAMYLKKRSNSDDKKDDDDDDEEEEAGAKDNDKKLPLSASLLAPHVTTVIN